MKNRVEDLRNHLFETLEALKDKEAPMDIERARAVAMIAKEITDSARVEVEYAKVTGQDLGSGFLQNDKSAQPAINGGRALPQLRRTS